MYALVLAPPSVRKFNGDLGDGPRHDSYIGLGKIGLGEILRAGFMVEVTT